MVRRFLPRVSMALASLALIAGMGAPAAAQRARLPASVLAPPAERFAPHPYTSALGAVANYQSCGIHARAAAWRALERALRAGEADATLKGLGPTLERLRQDYYALRAVSSMTACGGGPRRALAFARRAVAAFRTWVAEQPGP